MEAVCTSSTKYQRTSVSTEGRVGQLDEALALAERTVSVMDAKAIENQTRQLASFNTKMDGMNDKLAEKIDEGFDR